MTKSKFSFKNMVKELEKESSEEIFIGTGADVQVVSQNPEDFVVMPDWWHHAYGVPGIQFGRIVQLAGDSDSGKTTLAMQAIKNAQDQGYGVVYTETEGKTPINYFENWEIDPEGVGLVQSKFTEHAFDGSFAFIDKFFEANPKEKLLFVFDSYGNTVSARNEDASMVKEERVGGTAKVNRRAINILMSKMQKHPIAVLIVNYTYDNIGSHGKTNAGGKALNFFSTLTIQSQRSGWVTGQVNKQKVVKGAEVQWTTFKNHYAQALRGPEGEKVHLPQRIHLSITDEGFTLLEKKK